MHGGPEAPRLRLSIDDFGTGYSSSRISSASRSTSSKIDQSFVNGLGRPGTIARSPARSSRWAGISGSTVLAEGVRRPINGISWSIRGATVSGASLYAEAIPVADFERWFGDAGPLEQAGLNLPHVPLTVSRPHLAMPRPGPRAAPGLQPRTGLRQESFVFRNARRSGRAWQRRGRLPARPWVPSCESSTACIAPTMRGSRPS